MNSIAFSILNFNITWYSIFILIGVIIGSLLFIIESKKYGINSEFCTNLLFWTIIFGIIGARLYYVIFNLDLYTNFVDIFKVWNGGLAIHGGILFGLLFIIYYTKKYQYRTLKITDILSVSLLIAQAFGRWGNFFNQEAHGPVISLSSLQSIKIIPQFIINGMNINGTYYVPTFYYESLWCLLGFIILLLIRKYVKYLKRGTLTSIYFIWYGIGRLYIESLRTDSLMLGSFKVAEIVSIVLIIIGNIILFKNLRKKRFDDLYGEMEASNVRF